MASAVASLVIEKTGGVAKERFPDYKQVTQRVKSIISKEYSKFISR